MARMDEHEAAVRITGRRVANAEKYRQQHIGAVIAALAAGCSPGDVSSWSPFTATYLRKLAREAGIPAAAPGRKPKPPDG